jgi:type IV secretion system protein VirB4
MFKPNERLLSEYVPWGDYASPDVIMGLDGSVLLFMAVDGLPFETVDDAIVAYQFERLEAAIRDASQPGLIFHILQCRGAVSSDIYPDGQFRTTFSESLDRAYKAQLFGGARGMWLNQTYIAVQLAPAEFGTKAVSKVFGRWQKKQDAPQHRIDRLIRIASIFKEQIREYRPRILSVERRGGILFSQAAEAVAFAMTGYWRPVPMTVSGAASVFSEPFIVGHEAFEVRMPHKSTWGACLVIQDFPFETRPGMFDRFLSSSYHQTIHHSFRCLPSLDGQALVTRKQNRMKWAGDRALSQAGELADAGNLIASNRLMMGDYGFSLTVFSDSPARLDEIVQQAWGDLSSNGIKVERENIALEAALFSAIPGNFRLRTRQAAISSRNFAAFAGLHNFPLGETKGFWGGPVGMLRTSGGTPFHFHLHFDGVGNAFISGAVGSGKTMFLGWVICQAERSGAQIVLWDKDRGLEALVRALDGYYLSLTNAPGLGTGLAPLKRLSDSPEDLTFLAGLIRACIATPEHYNLTPEEDRRLGIGLRHVMRLPPQDRCMEEVRAFLGTDRSGAGARLEKWCWGNEFGWIIDCPKDIIELDGRVIGFDQSDLLNDRVASGATMATLFHYTGKLVDGRRLLFLLDEVWNALLIDEFNAEIHNGLKTWRKYNSPILIATQDVADGLNSPIGHTIRSQTPNQMYFATPGAVWKDYGPEGMKLTATEFDIIQKLPKGRGFFLLKQGDRSVVVQCPMEGMDEVAVISGTRRGATVIQKLLERDPDLSGARFVAEYQKEMADA